jgi:hypothetical protein
MNKFPTPEELSAQQAKKAEDALEKTARWVALVEKASLSEVAGMLVDDLQVLFDSQEDGSPSQAKLTHEAQELIRQAKGLLRLSGL